MFVTVITILVLSIMCLACLLSLVDMVRENWPYVGHGKAVFYALTIIITAMAYANFIFDCIK